MQIVPYIPLPKRGFAPTAPLCEIMNAILYKMKSGMQWGLLPVGVLFSTRVLSWQFVYDHYRKWCLGGNFMGCCTGILGKYRSHLDLSIVDFDGSHAPALRGGEAVNHQGRKRGKTTNTLSLTDRQALPLAKSEPVAGNHNDLFNI